MVRNLIQVGSFNLWLQVTLIQSTPHLYSTNVIHSAIKQARGRRKQQHVHLIWSHWVIPLTSLPFSNMAPPASQMTIIQIIVPIPSLKDWIENGVNSSTVTSTSLICCAVLASVYLCICWADTWTPFTSVLSDCVQFTLQATYCTYCTYNHIDCKYEWPHKQWSYFILWYVPVIDCCKDLHL